MFFEYAKTNSWDAHLDHLGFPKMYESSLCGDRCGRKRDAMDPSKVGTDGHTEKFNTISFRFTGNNKYLILTFKAAPDDTIYAIHNEKAAIKLTLLAPGVRMPPPHPATNHCPGKDKEFPDPKR